MKANRVVDIRDLNALAPNVTVRTIQGGGSGALVATRGLVTGPGRRGPGADADREPGRARRGVGRVLGA